MVDINDTDYYLVTEYLEEQLWLAKEQKDGPAVRKLERVLEAYDSVVDVLKGREHDGSDE